MTTEKLAESRMRKDKIWKAQVPNTSTVSESIWKTRRAELDHRAKNIGLLGQSKRRTKFRWAHSHCKFMRNKKCSRPVLLGVSNIHVTPKLWEIQFYTKRGSAWGALGTTSDQWAEYILILRMNGCTVLLLIEKRTKLIPKLLEIEKKKKEKIVGEVARGDQHCPRESADRKAQISKAFVPHTGMICASLRFADFRRQCCYQLEQPRAQSLFLLSTRRFSLQLYTMHDFFCTCSEDTSNGFRAWFALGLNTVPQLCFGEKHTRYTCIVFHLNRQGIQYSDIDNQWPLHIDTTCTANDTVTARDHLAQETESWDQKLLMHSSILSEGCECCKALKPYDAIFKDSSSPRLSKSSFRRERKQAHSIKSDLCMRSTCTKTIV